MYIEKVIEEIEKYEVDLSGYHWNEGIVKGCTKNQVYHLQRRLGFKLPKAYKEFLFNFGFNPGNLPFLKFKEIIENTKFAIKHKIVPKDSIILFYDRVGTYISFIRTTGGDNPIVYNGFTTDYEFTNQGCYYNYESYGLEPSDTFIEFLIKEIRKQAFFENRLYLNPSKSTIFKLSILKQNEVLEVLNNFNANSEINTIFTEIPENIFQLENIQKLTFNNCGLKEISKKINKLNKLEYVNFSKNILNEFPVEFFELINLKYLDISFNNFTQLPNNLVELKDLEMLLCSGNNFEKFPTVIFNLSKLKVLELKYCKFKEVNIENINENEFLPKLEFLSVSHTELFNFPEWILKLKNLRTLILKNCNLSRLPKEIKNLENLKKIVLDNNEFGSIPEELLGIKNLKVISFKNCDLESISSKILKLKHLVEVNIAENKIETLPLDLLEQKRIKIRDGKEFIVEDLIDDIPPF